MQVATFTTPGVHMEDAGTGRRAGAARQRRVRRRSGRGARHSRSWRPCRSTIPPRRSLELERAMSSWACPARWCSATSTAWRSPTRATSRCGRRPTSWAPSSTSTPRIRSASRRWSEYWLMPLVGFLMDTTLAAAHLVFAGIPRRYPADHLGAVPHGRRDSVPRRAARPRLRSVCRLPRQHRSAAERLPQAVLLRHGELRSRAASSWRSTFAGVDHILAGSDYPHQIGSIPKMLQVAQGPGRAGG